MAINHLLKKVKDFIIPVHSVVRMDQTVDEALTTLRKYKIDEKVIYFYVVDREFRLVGVVSTRNLLLNPSNTPIREIMIENVIALSQDQSLQEAMQLLTDHHLLAIPVIDEEKHLMGIIDIQIYVEEAVDIARSQRRVDLFQMLGVTLEEGKRQSTLKSFRIRMPWMFCNMLGGIACAIISRIFEFVLAKVLLLAMFIPLVLTLSESISMQSMTNSLQLLHGQGISWKRILYRIFLEFKMVLLLALCCGILVGAISLFWGEGIGPALVIAMGIFLTITCSASIGSSIPLILHAKKLDPKVAAGPVVLMFVDVMTTTVYLGLATFWLL